MSNKYDNVVLDFGCGTGYGTAMLADYCKEIIGVDLSSVAINFASNKYIKPNLKFMVANVVEREIVETLQKGKYNLIVSFDVIEHLADYQTYLQNIYDLLSENGVFIMGTPNKLMTLNYNKHWNPYHKREFSPIELKAELKKIFKRVEIFGQDLSERIKCRVQRNLKPTIMYRILKKGLKILGGRALFDVTINNSDIIFSNNIDKAFGLMAIVTKK